VLNNILQKLSFSRRFDFWVQHLKIFHSRKIIAALSVERWFQAFDQKRFERCEDNIMGPVNRRFQKRSTFAHATKAEPREAVPTSAQSFELSDACKECQMPARRR
jgi:hypothetical protein